MKQQIIARIYIQTIEVRDSSSKKHRLLKLHQVSKDKSLNLLTLLKSSNWIIKGVLWKKSPYLVGKMASLISSSQILRRGEVCTRLFIPRQNKQKEAWSKKLKWNEIRIWNRKVIIWHPIRTRKSWTLNQTKFCRTVAKKKRVHLFHWVMPKSDHLQQEISRCRMIRVFSMIQIEYWIMAFNARTPLKISKLIWAIKEQTRTIVSRNLVQIRYPNTFSKILNRKIRPQIILKIIRIGMLTLQILTKLLMSKIPHKIRELSRLSVKN